MTLVSPRMTSRVSSTGRTVSPQTVMRTATSHLDLLHGVLGELVQVGKDSTVPVCCVLNLHLGLPEHNRSAGFDLEYAQRCYSSLVRSWSTVAHQRTGPDGKHHSSPVTGVEHGWLVGVLG